MAGLVHYVIGMTWKQGLLVAGALAPTDPAVMFSVLGGREIKDRISVILQGESGANDPVGIAVVLGLIEVDRHQAGVGAMVLHVTLGLAIGALVGAVGGVLMRRVLARPTLATDSLYPLRSLAGAGIIYGVASVLDGSGFLAVFIAGMLVAEAEAPRGKDIELVHQVFASLGEIVVFVALGLTIHLDSLGFHSVWVDGLIVSVMLVLIARPLVVALLLTPLRYPPREQAFISWAGLRGAVPILLAAFTLIEGLPGAHRIYGLVFVVVLVTVLVQGTLLPWVAERCEVTEPAAP
jgi:cell volume regulation protein A